MPSAARRQWRDLFIHFCRDEPIRDYAPPLGRRGDSLIALAADDFAKIASTWMSAQSTSGKGGSLADEGQEQVGAAQHDRLGAALAHQLSGRR